MEILEQYLSYFDHSFDKETIWIIEVFIVIFATALISFFAKKILLRLLKQAEKTKTKFDDIFINASTRPVTWIIWLSGISLAIDIIYAQTSSQIFSAFSAIRDIGILVAITWFVLGIIKGVEASYKEKQLNDIQTESRLDSHTIEAISKLVRLSVIITAALVILQTLGYSISGILAFGGVGGVAVGFAAKDLLANFFGGLMVYLDRPFTTGDWIRSPDREIEGTVEKIGWRMTQIRTFDKRPLYIPNSIFSTIMVENPSRMTNRRIYETIGIRYDDIKQMDSIVAGVKKMLRDHPDIDQTQTLIVNFNQFSDSSVDFFIYTFTKTIDWVAFHDIKQDVLLKVSDVISQNQAEIAFPTTRIQVDEMLKIQAPK